MSRIPKVIIDSAYCKGCGICIHFYPKHILDLSEDVNALGYHPPTVVNGGECSACGQCELFCPDFAIFIVDEVEDG